jgi:hypothetical protein
MVAINHTKNVIFFHIPKTAGSYIQRILHSDYNFCNYNDLARIEIDDVLLFLKNGRNHNNGKIYNTNPWSSKDLGIYRYFETSETMLSMMMISSEKLNNMYKFTFVRDPYSRFISSWNFVINGFKNKKSIIYDNKNLKLKDLDDLEFFIEKKDKLTAIAYNHVFITQYEHIKAEDGTIKMDFIGKLENIENDLEIVLKNIGFDTITHKSDKVNKTEHKYYKEYYTENIFKFVNEFFDIDFTYFGYKKFTNLDDFLKNSTSD